MEAKSLMIRIIFFLLVIIILSYTFGESLVEEKKPSFESFVFIHFTSYLFFLIMPAELLYLYYLSQDHNIFLLFSFAIFTALSAQAIDFMIGSLLSKKIISTYVSRKRYTTIKNLFEKYKKISIFIFSATFLSSPIAMLVAGIAKIDFRTVMLYSFLGLFAKYLAISIFWLYLTQ